MIGVRMRNLSMNDGRDLDLEALAKPSGPIEELFGDRGCNGN